MEPHAESSKLLPIPQTVRFTGTDESNSSEVFCEKVTIVPSSGLHETGSSKVKLKNVVDFSWELRFYTGQLLAVHVGGKYIAYGLKAVGTNNGVIRVVNRESSERSLLKGIEGMVQDIAFAHIPNQVVLACVDEYGNLLVHQIEETKDKMVCTLLLHVEQNNDRTTSSNHRVIWCPYIPEEENSDVTYDDVAKLLVLTHGAKAEMWNVGMVTAKHGVGPLQPETVEEGYLEIMEHTAPIIDAAFAPDGTALATASLDGNVKFFQVYMHNDNKPRCLHQWQPHDGKPLSSLFFLDNHKMYNPEVQFWKFAITGAENNSELKIWSCESWTCLQTIRFTPEVGKQDIVLKAGLDLGAGYLLLSDINYKLLYVLQLHKDPSETSAYVCSVSEFRLPYPILSFGIVDAGLRKFKSSSLEDLCNEDGDDEAQQFVQAVVVRMYLVQPKSLQECHIAFQPPATLGEVGQKLSTLSHDSLLFRDGFSDLSTNGLSTSVAELEAVAPDLPANHMSDTQQPANINSQQQQQQEQQQLNLMTPDAFSSPAKKDSPTDIRSPQVVPVVDQPLATSELQEVSAFQREGFASGGSSPSREVQEILSLKGSERHSHGYYSDKVVAEVVESEIESQAAPTAAENLQFDALVKGKDVTNVKPSRPETDGWPQIPITLVNQFGKSVSSEEKQTKRNAPIHLDGIGESGDGLHHKLSEANQKLENTVTTLDHKINSIVEIMQQHQLEIKKLLEEVSTIRQAVSRDHASPSLSPRMEAIIMSQLDKALVKHQQQHMALLEELLLQREDKERKRQEALMCAISQAVGNLVTAKLEDIVTAEIKNSIIPALVSTMEPLKHQLHIEMTQKLTSTDHLLKENITKLVHSKSVMEVLGNSVVTALQPAVQHVYKEVFTSLVMPSFEKSCQSMFQQINESFSKGTKEYIQALEGYIDKQRRQQEKGRDIVGQIQVLSDSFRTNHDHLTSAIQEEVRAQVKKGLTSIQDSLNKTVCEAVRENITKGFRGQQDVIQNSVITAVRSRAVTPAPHIVDCHVQQLQIEQLIGQGQINAAFQQALSASDLSLVVFICEKVNPQQVFNQTPCPLQQPVLLSLIQQLSADMSNHTELKHKYLEEAVMNLDATNVLTKEHMPGVLTNLQRQLTAYILNNPNNKITRSMRMLSMATQSLLNVPCTK
ncbi:enhancer of mRNA-decapping protein 4 isoform X2 [Zootermopsis nevadensis]|uniref:enhancer of mRNA-decapping protein 4 isoform X2 n=1 Tax=Zootermopsis nevadensis TaxID=136037 RepID=UPI000B8EA76C|nr:enhancer of mRNA-decapping protein 4 isoform X2 [Zootermopsis nevadensis]